MRRLLIVMLAIALAAVGLGACVACVRVYPPDGKNTTDPATPTTPTPPPAPVVHTVEYRALGVAHEAALTYGNAQEGATEIDTIVPWSASFQTTRTSLFVYITGTAPLCGVLRVQILIDGVVYREAATDGSCGAIASASGTAQMSATALGLVHEVGPSRPPR